MVRRVKDPEKELREFSNRKTDGFAAVFTELAKAKARDAAGLDFRDGYERAMFKVEEAISQSMIMADLFGRRRVFLEFDAIVDRMSPEERDAMFSATPLVPNVPFSEAFASIVSREPRLAANADEVAELYRNRHAFALAKSADVALTARVQEVMATLMKEGIPSVHATTILDRVMDYTRSYADTVYRTNLTTAYTAGRFKQAQEPGVRTVLPAMERFSIRDSVVRRGRKEDHGENHVAAHGFTADTRSPEWAFVAPPSGYGCRCGVRLVPAPELKRRGLLDAGKVVTFRPVGFNAFRPHGNFGQKNPASLIYRS